tara:strand:- start:1402 stop:1578 length:177 start_codon:yes stop_codon:yes gene_type:complete
MVNDWKPVAVMEGMQEVWVTFYSEELDQEKSIQICSVDDLIWRFVGDDVSELIEEEGY